MIKEFYSNPGTFEPEVVDAFAFPEQKVMKQWVETRVPKSSGPIRSLLPESSAVPVYLAMGLGIALIGKAMGPHGEAMKIVVNKRMSPLRYYGLRVGAVALFAFAFNTVRSRTNFSNPYSRGELK